MAMRKARIEDLGTVTTGTPSKPFSLSDCDHLVIYVRNPSVSQTLQLQASFDGGTTWINYRAASAAMTSATILEQSAPLPAQMRLTLSAGNSPVSIERMKTGMA